MLDLIKPEGAHDTICSPLSSCDEALFSSLPVIDSDGCLKDRKSWTLSQRQLKLRIRIPRSRTPSPVDRSLSLDCFEIPISPYRTPNRCQSLNNTRCSTPRSCGYKGSRSNMSNRRIRKLNRKSNTPPTQNSTLPLYHMLYEELEFLGSGGMGVVYKVRNRADGLYYAVKKFHGPRSAGDTRIMHLDHQNVIRYFNCFFGPREDFQWKHEEPPNQMLNTNLKSPLEDPSNYSIFIVMQYYPRGTIQDYINSRSFVDRLECDNFSLQIAEGIKYLHGQGIIHRDLKPANLFLTSDGLVKIGDFDLATTHRGPATIHSKQIGTPTYASPEQWVTGRYTFTADNWSLGIIMYELFSIFNTTMERDRNITQLRTSGLVTATLLEKYQTEMDLVQKLVNLVPENRLAINKVIAALRPLVISPHTELSQGNPENSHTDSLNTKF